MNVPKKLTSEHLISELIVDQEGIIIVTRAWLTICVHANSAAHYQSKWWKFARKTNPVLACLGNSASMRSPQERKVLRLGFMVYHTVQCVLRSNISVVYLCPEETRAYFEYEDSWLLTVEITSSATAFQELRKPVWTLALALQRWHEWVHHNDWI